MPLGHRTIKLFMKLGWIYCNPAPRLVTEASLDVTLGSHFWFPNYDTYHRLEHAYPAKEQFRLYSSSSHVLVPASGFVLAHTEEFVGSTVPFIVPEFRVRGTTSRWGATFAPQAGWGEGGFHGRWAGPLVNFSAAETPWYVGDRFGQIVFWFCIGGGLYNRQYGADESAWTPETMLPKTIGR